MRKLRKLRWLGVAALAAVSVLVTLSTVYGGHPKLWKAPDGEIQWVAQETAADGNIIVRSGTSRHAGYRIGDIVPVSVVIVASKDVRVDFSNVLNGTLSDDAQPAFELAETPTVSHFEQNGKNVWRIDLAVRSWKVEPELDFHVDVQYGVNTKEGWEWSTISSPTVTIQTTRSAQKDDEFDMGDARPRTAPANAFGRTLVFLGGWTLLCFVVFTGIKYGRRLHRKLTYVSPEEQSWHVFDDVFATARSTGWTEAHYIALSTQLRRYLHLEPLTASEVRALTPAELDKVPEESIDILVRTFDLLEAALYAERQLNGVERAQLETDLETLVPRKPVTAPK